MKKYLLLFLVFAINLLILSGCKTDENNYSEISYTDITQVIDEYDSESRIVIDTENNDNSSENTGDYSEAHGSENVSDIVNENGSFIVKDKKYTYKGKDLVILNVENQTSKNYTVTITGYYYDGNGKELKSETHSFKGFASGYTNYFLFAPDLNFENFKYTLNAVEYDGKCFAENITSSFSELREQRWPIAQITGDHFTEYPMITAHLRHHNGNDKEVSISALTVVFDKHGNIFHIEAEGIISVSPNEYASSTSTIYYELTEDEMTWPDELNGDVKALTIICDISEDFTKITPPIEIYKQFGAFGN